MMVPSPFINPLFVRLRGIMDKSLLLTSLSLLPVIFNDSDSSVILSKVLSESVILSMFSLYSSSRIMCIRSLYDVIKRASPSFIGKSPFLLVRSCKSIFCPSVARSCLKFPSFFNFCFMGFFIVISQNSNVIVLFYFLT